MKSTIEGIIKTMEKNDIHINDLIDNKNEFSLGKSKGNPVIRGTPTKKKHICVAIPINRSIPAESFTSLFQLYAYLSRKYNVSFTSSIATYLHEGRNLILKNAWDIHKNAPIDYVLWIDSDSVFTTDDFEKMLEMSETRNIPFLSALYFTKRSKACKPVYLIKKEKDYKLAENYPKNALIKVDGVGFGFFLCRAKELFQVYAKHGSKTFMLEEKENTGKMVGEDVVFSKAVTKEGFPLIVWTDVCIGHEGGVTNEKVFGAVNSKETLDKVQWAKPKLPLIIKGV